MIDKYFPLYVLTFALTFSITTLCEKILIPILKAGAKQPIYEGGPRWHLSKSGTPTMGGLAFLIGVSLSLVVASLPLFFDMKSERVASLYLCLGFSVLNSLIGVIDDVSKLKKRENKGLTALQKILLQSLVGILFLVGRTIFIEDATVLYFSFGEFDIGWLYYPFGLFLLLGITNCANLTDGIDGLAGSVAFSIGISLFYISSTVSPEVSLIGSSIIGATLSFLIFNLHPAKIFMGDTGSLFLGSLVVSSIFSLGNPILSITIGSVYVIEGVSVVLQVIVYKMTKKRLFKMAPLHHHFERCGWSENRICIVGMIITFLTSISAYILYLP